MLDQEAGLTEQFKIMTEYLYTKARLCNKRTPRLLGLKICEERTRQSAEALYENGKSVSKIDHPSIDPGHLHGGLNFLHQSYVMILLA